MTALTDLKTYFAKTEKVLRNNKFFVAWTGLNKDGNLQGSKGVQGGDGGDGIPFGDLVPAKAVQFPGQTIEFDTQEFQGLRRQIPRKRNNTQQLLITFYLGSNLLSYNQIVEWMVAVSGKTTAVGTVPSNKVPYISAANLYNEKIKNCFLNVYLEDIYTPDGTNTPALALLEVYPSAIQPINLSVDATNQFATFDVLFNYVEISRDIASGLLD